MPIGKMFTARTDCCRGKFLGHRETPRRIWPFVFPYPSNRWLDVIRALGTDLNFLRKKVVTALKLLKFCHQKVHARIDTATPLLGSQQSNNEPQCRREKPLTKAFMARPRRFNSTKNGNCMKKVRVLLRMILRCPLLTHHSTGSD
jgi:hypothetical protein